MSIRSRLTLWFASVLVISLIVMAFSLHYELREDRQLMRKGQAVSSAWEETGEFLLAYGLPTALLLLVGGSWMLRRSLDPISRMTAAAENLHLNRLHERLPPVGTGDELDRLTQVFNAMTARLEESVARIREFTLHASHELKTPLTIMHGELEAALAVEDLPMVQRELLASQLDEVQRLMKIVENLMFLAKADAGLLPLASEPVRLDELIQESFADARLLARPKSISVRLNAGDPVTVRGDRHRLRQLLLNLTENAIKYNQPQGFVEMTWQQDGDQVEFRIANSGPGISPEKMPHAFERFFRGDPSHSSEVEGSGLGLAIAQSIVHAHSGTIRLSSRPDPVTTVSVRLPLASVLPG
jgi:signal transduction histidine kinase